MATGAEQYNGSQVYDNGNGATDTPKGGLRELFPGIPAVSHPSPSRSKWSWEVLQYARSKKLIARGLFDAVFVRLPSMME